MNGVEEPDFRSAPRKYKTAIPDRAGFPVASRLAECRIDIGHAAADRGGNKLPSIGGDL